MPIDSFPPSYPIGILLSYPVLVSLSADTNNYTGLNGYSYAEVSSTLDINLSGFIQPVVLDVTNSPGAHLWLINTGSFNITILHESVSSAATNRITTSSGANKTLAPGESIHLIYSFGSVNRWKEIE